MAGWGLCCALPDGLEVWHWSGSQGFWQKRKKRYRKPHSVLYSLCPFSQPLALLMLLNLELPSQALEMNRSSFFITYLNNVLKVAQLLQGWIPQYELIRENFSLYRRKSEFGWAQALNFPRNQWKNEGSAWRCKKLGKTLGQIALNLFRQRCKNFPCKVLSDVKDV